MERKRKLPARAAREQPARKKRTSTPPEPRTKTPTPAPTLPAAIPEETLPKSISSGKPLPTVEQAQPEDLPSTEFQSIHESGVLAESLQRSKQKWLSEGIFERYWTKPVKKKGTLEQPENNPAKDTMTKLGPCTITVEPHIFDAVMYAIKDTTPRPPPEPPVQTPQQMYRPIIQYGPPGGMMPPPAPTPPPPKQFPTPQATPQASPRSQDVQMANTGPLHNTTNTHGSVPNGYSNSPTPNTQKPMATNIPPPPAPTNKSTDPVIQMLAERAATDPDLKALMRIVANGEATADQLKKFQSHIDELTRIQRDREAAERAKAAAQTPLQPQSAIAPANGQNENQPAPKSTPTPTPPTKPAPTPHGQPQALRSKGPLPPTKPEIAGIVFEFPGGSGDRFQFPKFSILEYLPGGQVIASFLIVRKGSSSDSPSYNPDLDYYQPITIRLYAHQSRQLDALQKIVAPAEEVRRYMDDIMDHATRAEYVLLAMRLPKDKEGTPETTKKDDESGKDNVNGMGENVLPWVTTTSTPIPKVKPAKKIPTNEENYQSYIASVAAEVV